jgi:hypothetical protein
MKSITCSTALTNVKLVFSGYIAKENMLKGISFNLYHFENNSLNLIAAPPTSAIYLLLTKFLPVKERGMTSFLCRLVAYCDNSLLEIILLVILNLDIFYIVNMLIN